MHFLKSGLSAVGTALFAAFLTFSASAGGGNDQGQDQQDRRTVGAPGPIAGVGLVGVAVAGGVTYLLGRIRRKPDQN